MHAKAARRDAIIVWLLLVNGASVASMTEGRSTQLHTAAEVGHYDIVELLLKTGGNAKFTTDIGATPSYRVVVVAAARS